MGNKGSVAHSKVAELVSSQAKKASNKFDIDELHLLSKTWQDLAGRNIENDGIDKDTFLQFFPLNGLLGDRLFVQFDAKKRGYIDYDDFIIGLSLICRGTEDEKSRFIFSMYDVYRTNTVSRQELTTLLNHVPTFVLHAHDGRSFVKVVHSQKIKSRVEEVDNEDKEEDVAKDFIFDDVESYTNQDVVERAFENGDDRLTYAEFKSWLQDTPSVIEYLESILPYSGQKEMSPHHNKKEALPIANSRGMVSRGSFASIDSSTHGRKNELSISQSGKYTKVASRKSTSGDSLTSDNTTPLSDQSPAPLSHLITEKTTIQLLQQAYYYAHGEGLHEEIGLLIDSIPGAGKEVQTDNGSEFFVGTSPPCPTSPTSHSSKKTTPINLRVDSLHNSDYGLGDDEAYALLQRAFENAKDDDVKANISDLLDRIQVAEVNRRDSDLYREVVQKEGFLYKRGETFHMWSKRWYLLSGSCIYYYSSKSDIRPKGVIFLTGSLVEKIQDGNYFGFELVQMDMCTEVHHRHEKRQLFTKNQNDRNAWVSMLQKAAQAVPIEQEYTIGKEIGSGAFSRVCECVSKMTGLHYAVKIIDKQTLQPDEKQLLKTEIAVLKLVNHPNIVHMVGLYENRRYLYIVMEIVEGGELFDQIVGKPRFTEEKMAKLLLPLLESVAYLHDLGIAHRDLKPENILCGDNLSDVKLADFGLSKMILPKEKMDAACGTLSYVAPEVLTLQGYGKETDIWAVGVIMCLLVCGQLPFDADEHEEMLRRIINADMQVNKKVWNSLDPDAQGIIMAMLTPNPKERITARNALKHPFIQKYCPKTIKSMSTKTPDRK